MLRLLIIDDNKDDRTLAIYELRREFPELQVEEVFEASGLSRALSAGNFDLVITDYRLRWNDGISVLHDIKSRYPNCPVIMFTDSGSQEIAVEAMKAGLDDYIIKSAKHYSRLSVAIRSTLQRVESQRKAALLEMRLQSLLNRLNVGVFRSTLDGHLLEGNTSFLRLLGVSSLEEAQTLNLQELLLQPETELRGLTQEREVHLRRADGSSTWILVSQTLNTSEAFPVVEGLSEDITERKLAQEALKRANDELEIRVAERTQELRQVNEQLLREMRSREQAQQSVCDREQRYRQLVELCPDAIFIQCQGKFVFINSATVKLYGATNQEELIGKSVLDTVHPDYQEIVEERIQQLLEEKPAEQKELKVVRLDGTVIDVEVAAVPFIYEDRQAAQVVVRDISDRKRAEAELRKALDKERELSELKSRIINTISHEYRTPLTAIISSAQLLETYGHRFPEAKKLLHLQRIQTSGKHLNDLVTDALFIGQAQADKLRCKPAPLDLEHYCRELIEEISSAPQNFTASSAESSIPKITFSVRGNCTHVRLDEKLLRQILTNLLSNAIKYSPERGTIRFDLECVENAARFCIQDSGIGIPKESLPQLFDSFYRARNVGTIPGTGLGLTIVKKCVDLHGGKITVNSKVDKGTKFTVTLPLN